MGSKVTKVKIGDKVGVGYLVGSCRSCDNCSVNLENYCPKSVLTAGAVYFDGTPTYGGFSNEMVCNDNFVVRFPDTLPLDAGAPLLCAGVTVYSPMKYYGFAKPGNHVGVNGLGGLGHVAVKFAKAFGAKVTVISRSSKKKEEAIDYLGADAFLVSQNPEEMKVIFKLKTSVLLIYLCYFVFIISYNIYKSTQLGSMTRQRNIKLRIWAFFLPSVLMAQFLHLKSC